MKPFEITKQQKEQFHEEGYMILEGVVPLGLLAMMREECSYFLGYMDAALDAAGTRVSFGTYRDKRYFICNQYRLSSRLWQFTFSPLMVAVTEAALGPNTFLSFEQWVVKGPDKGLQFAWHQDSGYLVHGNAPVPGYTPYSKPYLTCWCPIDDVNEANGTVYILPHSRGGTKHSIFEHVREPGVNDLVGYTGSDPGIPVNVPAGSVVAFSSYTLHRSGSNTTPRMRRVYVAHYSSEPIYGPGGKIRDMAVPFVKDGRLIYDHANDNPEQYGPMPKRDFLGKEIKA